MNTMQLRVPVVEDNKMASKGADSILTAANCQVDLAMNGTQALQLFSNRYDLVLLDLGLPDYYGLDLAQLMRKHLSGNANVPIVILSAHAVHEESCYTRAKALKLNGLFDKPFTDELCARLLAGVQKGETDFWE